MSGLFISMVNSILWVMFMKTLDYNRSKAASYARKWAMGRNPDYYDFSEIGGDCTNFVSQCIYAGSGIMNYTPVSGWFYRSVNDRTASWTAVEYLYKFLIDNQSVGPFGSECQLFKIQQGDIIQLGNNDLGYYHSLFVLHKYPDIRVAAHSADVYNQSLTAYNYDFLRCIHIDGVRAW